jgi:hypothetical protein
MTQPKSQISNIEHDDTSSIRNSTLILTKQKTKQKCKSLKLLKIFMGIFNVVQLKLSYSQNLDQPRDQRTRFQNVLSKKGLSFDF